MTAPALSAGRIFPLAKDPATNQARQRSFSKTGLASKKKGMRHSPPEKTSGKVFFSLFISEEMGKHVHHSFSNRSTSMTNTVAPPTETSTGIALYVPTP